MTLEFSVVVPTFDRLDVLPEVLAGLDRQAAAPSFEIVVVDDGSTDGTGEFLAGWLAERSVATSTKRAAARVHRQANRGPAAARNAGVELARGARVAFLGDDTVPEPGWLAAHARAIGGRTDSENLAVLGYTRWHPRMTRSPFLEYINEYGLQFGYSIIPDAGNVPFNFFYTSNISLPRQRLLEEPFDVDFPYPAWEDIETSYRLFRRGLRLIYEPSAVTLHDHPTTLNRFCERQEKAGYSAVVFFERHPELGPFLGLAASGPPELPSRLGQLAGEAVARGLQFFPIRTPRLWESTLRYHYIRGLRRGWRERRNGAEASERLVEGASR